MLIRRKAPRAAGDKMPVLDGRLAISGAAFGVLLASVGGCTLSDSLVPPNPIPGARPSDTATYSRDATPIDPSTGEDRMAMAAPASTPVEAGPLPPPAASAQPLRPSPSRVPREERQAVSFPAATQAHRSGAVRRMAPPVQESQPQPASAAPAARREAPRQSAATIRFTPVIGAPVSAIRPLSEQLEQSARKHGVVIRNTAEKPVDNILRGYFSVSRRGAQTELVYMWDVLDNSGTQLHRIQGTLTVPRRPGKAWESVPDATMKDIARKTISSYLAWRAAQAG